MIDIGNRLAARKGLDVCAIGRVPRDGEARAAHRYLNHIGHTLGSRGLRACRRKLDARRARDRAGIVLDWFFSRLACDF
jgi:hypothetical protein